MAIRSVPELTDVEVPAWTALTETINSSSIPVEVLNVHATDASRTLHALQVTVGSALGALAYNCGGVLIDGGWIRLLGGGTDTLPSLAAANALEDPESVHESPPFLTVGFDVLGGRFAIDGGGLGVAPGEVCYWAPDSLAWEGLGLAYGNFVHAFLAGATAEFYETWRWQDWEAEVAQLSPDQGLSLMPPPFTAEGANLANVSRRPIPFNELITFYDDMAAQSKDLGPGESFRLTVKD